MADRSPSVPNPFWDWSIAFYARPGVAPACLELQDAHGLDVNLVLFCVWSAAAGPGALDRQSLVGLDAAIAPWRAGVVVPLRDLRRTLKAGVAGIDAAAAARLRAAVQAAELDAERVEQDRLVAVGARPGRRPSGGAGPATARANLAALWALAVGDGAPPAAALETLVAAAFAAELSPPA